MSAIFKNQSDYDFDNSFDNNVDMETPQNFMLKVNDLQHKNKRTYANDDVDDGFNFETANLKYKKQKFEFEDEDEKSKKDVDLNGILLIEIQQL
uniref:Uncharacterized protein n=1 Tax=Panagrolaimus davidi TaxID=227884 RepID=A0A914QTD2_9BILA